MIDADDLGHLLEAVDISVEAWKEMPDADRAARLSDRLRVVGADLPAFERCRAHRPRSCLSFHLMKAMGSGFARWSSAGYSGGSVLNI
jgi:hypothetical protein